MVARTIEITEVYVDELTDIVAEKLLQKIKHYLDDLHSGQVDVFLTRTEAADFLKINSSTLWQWTNKGKIKCYGLGNRRYYNKKELIAQLKANELRH
ncbi:helix-turn-helix domain-containing protein [Aequorivita viscosa]|uniref:DNA binding domain-containing protein, excisionase family n=1 Tax=Aequorivita viscosa TaxID=797419 RepID=A0A1M6GYK6_9FLAO|nr:helix-turn-helix domain-containing protein [Aequorivita viscosa]SDW79974.1 DNA binding domain-containing protein, excisionase family [Aequorivita viscosa]SHJ14994.1 DNA binding domain-containing protein, excisionase family [Aequorivita viscosa]